MMSQLSGCVSRGPKAAGYDLAMELLATIPPAQPVRVRELAKDFRLASKDVRKHLLELERLHGWSLLTYGQADGHGDHARIHPAQREQVEAHAAAYWHDVWGE